jgi:hypothetical protein
LIQLGSLDHLLPRGMDRSTRKPEDVAGTYAIKIHHSIEPF